MSAGPGFPAATREELTPARRPYRPSGAALDLMRFYGPEVVLSGPAGTGKSRACLEKLHLLAEGCPGFRALIVRKTRESLTESALVTFEEKVVPEGHPILEGAQRRMRQAYRYPNGSSIVIGGMDKPTKVMSTEYDCAYVQEAIELTENDWESLTTRLRNGRLPYQQLLADTNPDSPQHWLKRRADTARTVMLESRHEDNPTLWDPETRTWTPGGREYIARLNALTGPRFQRLRHGRWVQAEGVVYDGWDRAVHLLDRDQVPLRTDWARYWSIDFGYTNPFVCLFWIQDPDGRLYRYRELYMTHRLVEDNARDILKAVGAVFEGVGRVKWPSSAEPRPRAIVCDHDAEGRATLERYLCLPTVAAHKEIEVGIQAVAARLRPAGDGKPRLFFTRDSLIRRDSALVEAKKPTCTEEEFDSYVWDLTNNRKKGEVPVDDNDHGLDALRYMVMHFDKKGRSTAPPAALNRGAPSASPFGRSPFGR